MLSQAARLAGVHSHRLGRCADSGQLARAQLRTAIGEGRLGVRKIYNLVAKPKPASSYVVDISRFKWTGLTIA